jgi:hypothetical protein
MGAGELRAYAGTVALGMTEPGQVDRDQVGAGSQLLPCRLEGEQAFRPRAQQQGVLVAVLACGETDPTTRR